MCLSGSFPWLWPGTARRVIRCGPCLVLFFPRIISDKTKTTNEAVPSDVGPTANPLRAGMRIEPTAPPCAMVIFGATGDLTRRKLLPALYRLSQQRVVPSEFAILGTSRPALSEDEFRATMKEAVAEFSHEDSLDESTWQSFAQRLFYLDGDFNDAALYQKLKTKLEEIDQKCDTQGNRIYYLEPPLISSA